MKETIEKALEGGALKVAGATGVAASVNSTFEWLNHNASGVGVLIALCSLLIGWYYSAKRHKNERLKNEIEFLKSANQEIKQELSELSSRKRDSK